MAAGTDAHSNAKSRFLALALFLWVSFERGDGEEKDIGTHIAPARALVSAGDAEPCADEAVGAPRVPVPRGRGRAVCRRSRRRTQGTCPPRAGVNRR
jgi:hypothetical protein